MKPIISIFVLLTCFSTTGWAVAGDSRDKMAQVAGNHEKYEDPTAQNQAIVAEIAETPTLLSEIRAVVDSCRTAELALRKQFPEGQNPELTRRLGELKRTSRMRILQIQLKYAQKDGRTELARRIRVSIEDLQRPMAPGGPRLSGRISPLPEAQAAVTPAGGSSH